MTVTTLDNRTALIVVDLQKGIVTIPLAHPVDVVVENSLALLDAFRRNGLPVVLVNVAGSPSGRTDQSGAAATAYPDGWTELIPELGAQPSDILITKYARSGFTKTGLEEQLRDLGVTQVVIVGIATASGVESTARHAHEYGFNVTLPVDAMTDRNRETHDHSVSTVFPRIAETGTTAEILALLAAARR